MKNLNPNQFLDALEKIYDEALQAATSLLKENGEKCYIAFSEWDCKTTDAYYDDGGCTVSIFGVGINEAGKLCVAAIVQNIGYGHSEDDFPQSWTEASELNSYCFPELYRFIAQNIDNCMTKAEADKIAKEYWEGEDEDF